MMTPDQAWEGYVGSQSRRAFLDMKPNHLTLEEYVAEYVHYLPNTVTDVDHDHFWTATGSDPLTVTDLLIRHLEDGFPY